MLTVRACSHKNTGNCIFKFCPCDNGVFMGWKQDLFGDQFQSITFSTHNPCMFCENHDVFSSSWRPRWESLHWRAGLQFFMIALHWPLCSFMTEQKYVQEFGKSGLFNIKDITHGTFGFLFPWFPQPHYMSLCPPD